MCVLLSETLSRLITSNPNLTYTHLQTDTQYTNIYTIDCLRHYQRHLAGTVDMGEMGRAIDNNKSPGIGNRGKKRRLPLLQDRRHVKGKKDKDKDTDRDRELEEAGAEQGQVDSLGGGGTVVGGIYVGKWAQRSLRKVKLLARDAHGRRIRPKPTVCSRWLDVLN